MTKQGRLTTVAVVPAAGVGLRMKSSRAKQFLSLDRRPVLAVTLSVLQACRHIDEMVLVAASQDVAYCREHIVDEYGLYKVTAVVPGGARRQDSVRLGIEATQGRHDLVLIHDGVRPLIDQDLLSRVIEAAETQRAVIAALPARETVKEVNAANEVARTLDRGRVWLVQTPQAFRYNEILKAHHLALAHGWEATDDAFLMEKLGVPVAVVEGSERNIKVTTPHDLELARFLLGSHPGTERT